MRIVLAAVVALLLASILAAPALALAARGLPGRALACALVACAATALAAWARRRRLPLEISAILLLPLAVAWGLGEGLGLFVRIAQWDLVAHLVAGLAIGALAAPALLAHLRAHPRRGAIAVACAAGAAALAGVLWEAGEWTVDAVLGSSTLGPVGDTIADLVADVAGALAGAAAALRARDRLPADHRRRLARPFRALARVR